jgi:hypothetical protein
MEHANKYIKKKKPSTGHDPDLHPFFSMLAAKIHLHIISVVSVLTVLKK